MQPKHCMFGKKALLSNFKFKCKVETSEQAQVKVTLHTAWSQPEYRSNSCPLKSSMQPHFLNSLRVQSCHL